jgi:hypothetical protein
MSDEEELQERLGKGDILPVPLPNEKRRLSSIPCIAHGLDPDCGCTATIDVELDLYHTAVLYPGLIAKAFNAWWLNHQELLEEK